MGCLEPDVVLGFVDGELAGAEREAVETHIDECATCRRLVSVTDTVPEGVRAPVDQPDRLGPYEVRGTLGRGGMGVVYRAYDPRLDREVAVKVVHGLSRSRPDQLAWFEREARAAARINHPNVMAVYDVGMHRGAPYVVTELLSGETLRERMRRAAVATKQVVAWSSQIAHGVAAAHDEGIVHRDLKPENLFITESGAIKILDFGVASFYRGGEDVVADRGVMVGTLGYMSPEQVCGEDVDHRADIFTLGVIIYEMLAGVATFDGDDELALAEAAISQDPFERHVDSLARVSWPLVQVVRRCLEKAPNTRFQSAHDLAFALDTLGSPSAIAPALGRRNKVSWPLAAVFASVVLVAAGVGWVLHRAPKPRVAIATPLTFGSAHVTNARFSGGSVYLSGTFPEDRGVTHLSRIAADGTRTRHLQRPALLAAMSSSHDEAALLVAPNDELAGTLDVVSAGDKHRDLHGADVTDIVAADFVGTELAVIRRRGGQYTVERPLGTVVFTSKRTLRALRASPAGELAFIEAGDGAPQIDRIATSEVRTSTGWRVATGLAWTRDGRLLVSGERDATGYAIWRVEDTSAARVWSAPGRIVLDDVRADGTALVTREDTAVHTRVGGAAGERDVSVLDGSQLVELARDGSGVLLVERGEGTQQRDQLFYRAVASAAPVALGTGTTGALSPDGTHVIAIDDGVLVDIPLAAPDKRIAIATPGVTPILHVAWPAKSDVVLYLARVDNAIYLVRQKLAGAPEKLQSWRGRTVGDEPFLVGAEGKLIVSELPEGQPGMFLVGAESHLPMPMPAHIVGWAEDALYGFDGTKIAKYDMDVLTGQQPKPPEVVRELANAPVFDVLRVSLTGDTYAYTTTTTTSQLFAIGGLP